MRKLPKRLLAFLLVFGLYSCGFQVIYNEKEKDSTNLSYVEELAAIRIKKNRDRLSQELKNNLYDILNPDYIKTDPKYFLSLIIKKSSSPTYITSTGSSGRNKITLTISYELKSLKTATIISKGFTSVNDNYDVTSNRYGTYVSENYISSNLTKTASQNIRNSLVNDFIENKKKCNLQKDNKNQPDLDSKEELETFICPF